MRIRLIFFNILILLVYSCHKNIILYQKNELKVTGKTLYYNYNESCRCLTDGFHLGLLKMNILIKEVKSNEDSLFINGEVHSLEEVLPYFTIYNGFNENDTIKLTEIVPNKQNGKFELKMKNNSNEEFYFYSIAHLPFKLKILN